MENPLVTYLQGNAFDYEPRSRADWLLCDVISSPEQTATLLLRWVRAKSCRHFVVTLKRKDDAGLEDLELLKEQLSELVTDFHLKKLCANKKEVCAFGTV